MTSSLKSIDGRYRVHAELGRGSMGRAMLVTDEHAGGVPYACKLLEQPQLHYDFIAEYRLLRRLTHPAFVRAYHLGVDLETRQPYMILELCQGESLAEARVGPEAIEPLAFELLDALDHLHRHDYVHGDLSPGNIVRRTADGRIKILDLGAGGRRGARRGSTSGVLAFTAPERLEGEALSPTHDLWSVGCVLYEQRFGAHPYPGYPARVATGSTLGAVGAERIGPLLVRLLALSAADRPASAAAALAEFESLGAVAPAPPATSASLAPFLDVANALERVDAAIRAAIEAGRPFAAHIDGAPGTGRTRLAAELASRLAARGIPVVRAQVVAGDTVASASARILQRLAPDAPVLATVDAATHQLARSASGRPHVVALVVDDIDAAQDDVAELFGRLGRQVTALPGRFARLVVITTGRSSARSGSAGTLGASEVTRVTLSPWQPGDVELWLEGLFPGRRVGSRVTAPIQHATRGNTQLTVATVDALLARDVLIIDSTSVRLRDPEAAAALAVSSHEEAAQAALAGLDEATRRHAAELAHSYSPPPASVMGLVADALVEAGVATWLFDPTCLRVTLASAALVDAARSLAPAAEAHRAAHDRWKKVSGDEAGAMAAWHALQAVRTPASVGHAEALLGTLPATFAMPLVDALVLDEAWPGDPDLALTAASILVANAHVERAIGMARRAVEAPSVVDATRARALSMIGQLEARQSRHARAVDALTEARRLGAGLPPAELAGIIASLARSAVMSGRIDDAESACVEALGLVEGDVGLTGRVLYTRGLVHWYRGALDRAESDFEEALEAAAAYGDEVEEAAVVTGLGLVTHRRGDLEVAVAHYRRALLLGDRTGDQARILTALQNLGVVYHERGAWTEALDTYTEAMGLARSLGHSGRVIQLAGNLGNLWRYLGEATSAESVLQEGLSLARRESNRHMEAITLNLLADVASDREQWTLAEALWTDAIAVASAAKCTNEEAEARINIGRLHLTRLAFADAEQALREGERIAAEIGQSGLVTQAAALRASVERQRAEGDAKVAAQHISRALAGVAELTNPDAAWPVLVEAAHVAFSEERRSDAREHAAQARAILKGQLDTVPGRHRNAFQARRDRRAAHHLLSLFENPGRAPTTSTDARATGWARLVEVNKRLLSEHNPVRLLEYIMDSAILLTEAERGFLLLVDERKPDGLEVHVARNLDQENIRKKHLKISRTIARRVIDAGEAVVTIDAMEDARYRDQLSVHDLRLRSILCLPMVARSDVLGAIYLDNRFQSSAFSDEDVRFMEAFADTAAIALHNAQLLADHAKSQSQLEQARAEVEALNQRLARKLEEREQELEDTHKVVIRQRRQLVAKHQYDQIVGTSDKIRQVFAMIDRLLDNDVPVLIEGESGTGKELVARAIHFNGQRQDRPFVAVNCGAIPPTLLESELFGHVRGAFTGANVDKKGLFEAAHLGTLLLDEIGELPLEMQVKLLRVLQSGEIKKVGATAETRVEVRIIAATNRTLADEVKAGRFREDLYYRLSVVPIHVPPLRARREDVPVLVQHFLEQNRKAGLGAVQAVSKETLKLLTAYDWPGNVRQLEMVLKNASVFADNPVLEPQDFESFPDIIGGTRAPAATAALRGKPLREIEREAIIVALRDNRGNKKRTAEQLGIDRRTLYNKLAAYKIVVERELSVR